MSEALDKECTFISETILVEYKILCCWGMGFIKLVASCEKCNTWHTELCTCTATRRYKLISEILPRSVITSEDRGSSTYKQLTYKLSEIKQTCQYVQLPEEMLRVEIREGALL